MLESLQKVSFKKWYWYCMYSDSRERSQKKILYWLTQKGSKLNDRTLFPTTRIWNLRQHWLTSKLWLIQLTMASCQCPDTCTVLLIRSHNVSQQDNEPPDNARGVNFNWPFAKRTENKKLVDWKGAQTYQKSTRIHCHRLLPETAQPWWLSGSWRCCWFSSMALQ